MNGLVKHACKQRADVCVWDQWVMQTPRVTLQKGHGEREGLQK